MDGMKEWNVKWNGKNDGIRPSTTRVSWAQGAGALQASSKVMLGRQPSPRSILEASMA